VAGSPGALYDETTRFEPFATSGNDRCLRIPAEDPRRFGSDSGHLVADPIGHQVRFAPLGVPKSRQCGEHNALLLRSNVGRGGFCEYNRGLGGERLAEHDRGNAFDQPHERLPPRLDWTQAQIVALKTQ
jgi:hypothetical protein